MSHSDVPLCAPLCVCHRFVPSASSTDEGLYYFSICVDHKIALWLEASEREWRSEGLKRMFCILLAGLKRLTKCGQQQQQLDANVAVSLSLSLSNAPRGVLSLVTIARRALTKYFH